MSIDIDFLTFCPCLVDILQLVDHSDIKNSRLVSKRLDHVIQKNPLGMPRPIAQLIISLVSENVVKIRVFVLNLKWSFTSGSFDNRYLAIYGIQVSNETVRLSNCKNQSIIHHYTTNNRPLTTSEEPQVGEEVGREEDVLTYYSRGLRDELRAMFSILLRRYHTNEIRLPNDPGNKQTRLCGDVLGFLCQQSKENHCKHMRLRVVEAFNWIDDSQLQAVVKALAVPGLEMALTTKNLFYLLPLYISMKEVRSVEFFTTVATFSSLKPLVDVVKSWLYDEVFYSALSFRNDGPFHWSMEEIVRQFSSFPGFRYANEDEKSYVRKISEETLLAVVEKTSDILLFLLHCNHFNILSVHAFTVERVDGLPNVYKHV